MKNVLLTPKAFEEISYWLSEDKRMVSKIFDLIRDIQRSPFSGLGKPEPLRHDFKGFWSRRISGEHRLIYRVDNEQIIITHCRFHYNK